MTDADRFDALEMRIAHQDQMIAELNEVITAQWRKIDALAQPTKSGFIFLLDRSNGKPIYPIKEQPVPTYSHLTGEKLLNRLNNRREND